MPVEFFFGCFAININLAVNGIPLFEIVLIQSKWPYHVTHQLALRNIFLWEEMLIEYQHMPSICYSIHWHLYPLYPNESLLAKSWTYDVLESKE